MPTPSEEEEAAAQLSPEEAAALDFLRKTPSDEAEVIEE